MNVNNKIDKLDIDGITNMPSELNMIMLSYLKTEDLKALVLSSKILQKVVIEVGDIWKKQLKVDRIAINDYEVFTALTPLLPSLTPLFPSMIRGTINVLGDSFGFGSRVEERSSLKEIEEMEDDLLLQIKAINDLKRPLVATQSEKIKISLGWQGIEDCRKYKAKYLQKTDVSEELKKYSVIRTSFPTKLPLKFFINKKHGDPLFIKFDERLFRFEFPREFEEDVKHVVSRQSLDHFFDLRQEFRNKVDRSFKSSFVDFDKQNIGKNSK